MTIVRYDGKACYIVTDNSGRSQNALGESTRALKNPGSILKFTYVKKGS